MTVGSVLMAQGAEEKREGGYVTDPYVAQELLERLGSRELISGTADPKMKCPGFVLLLFLALRFQLLLNKSAAGRSA